MTKSKKIVALAMCMLMVLSDVACGKKEADDSSLSISVEDVVIGDNAAEASSDGVKNFEIPEGMYLSEITGEPISEDIKDQRPIAVMVDNEKTALPHFGTAEADVVYEIMNSTLNDRVTRLMCIVKDWVFFLQPSGMRCSAMTEAPRLISRHILRIPGHSIFRELSPE